MKIYEMIKPYFSVPIGTKVFIWKISKGYALQNAETRDLFAFFDTLDELKDYINYKEL